MARRCWAVSNSRGWGQHLLILEFDRPRQAIVARVQVNEIRLTNVPALAGGSLGKMVQAAIDKRINPSNCCDSINCQRACRSRRPLALLRMRAKEVRPEIVPGTAHLHIVCEFLPRSVAGWPDRGL